jgi:beta-lysine 5,6-aminomutase beta subunit
MGEQVRPYGDTRGDGMVQLSFTLPVAHGPGPRVPPWRSPPRWGSTPAMVVHSKPIGPGFTFLVLYGSVTHLVDLDEVAVVEREFPMLSPSHVDAAIKRTWGRELVIIGACIGTDVHTVGIDARPRFDPAMANLGVDQVFGRGTTPGEVASYLVHALTERRTT